MRVLRSACLQTGQQVVSKAPADARRFVNDLNEAMINPTTNKVYHLSFP